MASPPPPPMTLLSAKSSSNRLSFLFIIYQLGLPLSTTTSTTTTRRLFSPPNFITCSVVRKTSNRRSLLLGGLLAPTFLSFPPLNNPLLAQEIPKNYEVFVDAEDGYSYFYPSDWRNFEFRGHDSAFKDRYLQLQNVRLSFVPTTKTDIHDMGSIQEVVQHLLKHVYSAPTQKPTIFDMQERTVDGKNYYTFEYALTSRNFSRAAFATIAIANGRYYTLIVGANERRWKKVRNTLKVVANSFKVLDI
ncbi:photosynthetic NDH subunit of lumenal location 1, chloroplastic [Impatiens glandulifera]|uniref:photosynthetic NDH subunit of lumenal location 1, chloroplastic n=1 Tax=Impatiens glandulifera TaxID=253017 RepID=UPI001FB0A98A|nr:photosynthetic NDH subunit of lumenal location 1, chloroplastic [Impatiens glandulifera]